MIIYCSSISSYSNAQVTLKLSDARDSYDAMKVALWPIG
jgi:hypothetical protein